uniref:Uncharacterized protein n=1 Tax=Mantoniella antarctica TaxID=81844 RepID=A0A7S0SMB7_9CHLO|mmetsp:Transcript_26504/g.66418  ORF Transcript_26504/g.66418 Transcript_26504/m.66418 type:complete len:115 (+) Transcript_26504:327-671(+)
MAASLEERERAQLAAAMAASLVEVEDAPTTAAMAASLSEMHLPHPAVQAELEILKVQLSSALAALSSTAALLEEFRSLAGVLEESLKAKGNTKVMILNGTSDRVQRRVLRTGQP